jgi:hypothetical protein
VMFSSSLRQGITTDTTGVDGEAERGSDAVLVMLPLLLPLKKRESCTARPDRSRRL